MVFSKYEKMSTDQLEEYLRQDFQMDDDAQVEVVLHIMAILDKRQKEESQIPWQTFETHYLPWAHLDGPLYALEEPPHKKRRVFWTLLVGAVILVTLVAGAYNPCRGMQEEPMEVPDEEVFTFPKPEEPPKEELLLKSIEHYLPSKIPEGYEIVEQLIKADDGELDIYATFYENLEEEMVIGVQILSAKGNIAYEKGDTPVVPYWHNGMQYYMMSNLAENKIVWAFQNFQGMVGSGLEPEALVEIVKTIPGPPWLRDNLEQFKITDPVTPQWMPEGYTLVSSESQSGQITTTYQLGMEQITLTISNQGQDVLKGEPYQAGGLTHTIAQGETLAHTYWDIPHWHCHLAGPITVEEAKKIIDSLYQ